MIHLLEFFYSSFPNSSVTSHSMLTLPPLVFRLPLIFFLPSSSAPPIQNHQSVLDLTSTCHRLINRQPLNYVYLLSINGCQTYSCFQLKKLHAHTKKTSIYFAIFSDDIVRSQDLIYVDNL